MHRPRVLISACLLGVRCRYNGEGGMIQELEALMERAELIPVCPEILGGLPTPRVPAERRGERVINRDGLDVTAAYARGARETEHLARLYGAQRAILKERSPSCGAGEIYDGNFAHRRIPGDGVAAAHLMQCGVRVYGESRVRELIKELEEEKNDTL